MRTTLVRLVWPRAMSTERAGMPRCSARNRTSSALALPSTAGPATRTRSASPCGPTTSERLAPGCTRIVSAHPSARRRAHGARSSSPLTPLPALCPYGPEPHTGRGSTARPRGRPACRGARRGTAPARRWPCRRPPARPPAPAARRRAVRRPPSGWPQAAPGSLATTRPPAGGPTARSRRGRSPPCLRSALTAQRGRQVVGQRYADGGHRDVIAELVAAERVAAVDVVDPLRAGRPLQPVAVEVQHAVERGAGGGLDDAEGVRDDELDTVWSGAQEPGLGVAGLAARRITGAASSVGEIGRAHV